MPIDRRRLLVGLSSGAAVLAAPLSAFGLDAAQFGVRAGSLDDQSRALQRAIDQAAHARVPLMMAPGVYRAGDLKLPAGTHLAGMRGASRLILTRGPSLLSAEHADSVVLSLSITHNFQPDCSAELDVGQARQASPHDHVARRRIAGARKIAAEASNLD